ncbi:ATP-dependent zinc metalloprotease FtsH [Caloramator mitchellensis]|uniref:ATP-dependent zinc metalloprotease FtsH n=1 Tax=Caloramator mitchellensis TaxID=908809 RepID=A0A0R3JX54_CALMK|nr:FtsH/Yme1/Tma family ATP-dependent metallopeptidase [Caloramator mitchellensis]KRQ88104.1 ATP-dependent zinc metalloprotease FtsH [Caloramator mitchellensis]
MNKILNYKKLIIFLSILTILTVSFVIYNMNNSKAVKISYTEFLNKVQNNEVSTIYYSEDEFIKFITKDNRTFLTENPRTFDFKEKMLLKGVSVEENSSVPIANTIAGIVSFSIIAIFIIMIAQKKVKSSSASLVSVHYDSENATSVTFQNIAGNEEAKESISELVDFIQNPEKYSRFNVRLPRGVILYGPPGTGKTLMAKALASEAKVPFFAVNGSDFVQVYVGVGAARIRDLFKKARDKGKAVIFIDEIDAIGKKRSGRADGASDERDQTLNALLSEMSGFKDSQGIIVIAATNRLDVLDEALLRPGRFDRHIEINLPDVKARYEILKLYSHKRPVAKDVDLFKVAQMTPYFSGAKLENLMNEAAILAAKDNADFITFEHIDKAFNIVVAGFEKKERSHISELDKKITAFHEAGHALISKIIAPENSVKKITIIPSTKGAGGYTLNIPQDKMFKTKKDLLNNIKIALGGRAAEEIIFGKDNITTGAYSDLQHATNTLISMAKEFGMIEEIGLLSYTLMESHNLIESTTIIKHCREIINNAYSEVVNILQNNFNLLEKIALVLIEKETIFEEELEKIICYENLK